MGASKSLPQTETINWKNLKTEQISDIPNLYGISAEANKLVEKINVPQLSESSSSDLDHLFLTKINNNNSVTNEKVSENFSSTSPFISSEMYKYVMNKYQQQNMVGGAANDLNDESETTSTSSSSDSSKSSSSSSSPVEQKPAKGKGRKGKAKAVVKGKKPKSNKKNTEAFLDYISSSAHTGGSITDNSSVANENNITVSSVRTSQINLISE
jgi:hypothetical protein